MLLHGINDNVLIPHSFYSGLYQDEEKNERGISTLSFIPWRSII